MRLRALFPAPQGAAGVGSAQDASERKEEGEKSFWDEVVFVQLIKAPHSGLEQSSQDLSFLPLSNERGLCWLFVMREVAGCCYPVVKV